MNPKINGILHDIRWQEINILADIYMIDNQGFTTPPSPRMLILT
jgi:hypothetical protein